MITIMHPVLMVTLIFSISFLNIGVKGDKHNVHKHNSIVMCHEHAWAMYRDGRGKFDLTRFDANLCTHVVHSQIGVDRTTYKIKVDDPSTNLNIEDGGKGGYKLVTDLKLRNNLLKTMISLGGWGEGSKTLSAIASTKNNRAVFINSVVQFLQKYNFDGIEIDWQHPTQQEGSRSVDGINFVYLLKELKAAFNHRNWLLGITLPGPIWFDIPHAYNITEINKIVDFYNILNYDFHGSWDNKIGHNSPLYAGKNGLDDEKNANHTTHYYVQRGIDISKTLFALPFFGRVFTLDDRKKHAIGDSAKNAPKLGIWSKEKGIMHYNEICEEFKSVGLWKQKRDDDQHVPFAIKDNYWLSFDDAKSIIEKVKYAIDNRFGGVSINTIDMDDLTGYCHDSPMYLLTTINKVFEDYYVTSPKTTPGYGNIPNQKNDNKIVDSDILKAHAKSAAVSKGPLPMLLVIITLLLLMNHLHEVN